MPKNILRKGQMQMGESMIAIILLLIIGIVIFVFAFNNANEKRAEQYALYQDLSAVEAAQAIVNMHELSCTKTGATTACIDRYKATTLATLIASDDEIADYYYDKFGYANITLHIIYPVEETITIYARTQEQQPARTITIPISVHDPAFDKASYATLSIKKYEATI